MARLNLLNLNSRTRTHEGAPAPATSPRSFNSGARYWLACSGRTQFYEDGVAIAGRIAELVPKVDG